MTQHFIQKSVKELLEEKHRAEAAVKAIDDILIEYQKACTHELPNGLSAIIDSAPTHPANHKYCSICKKEM